MHIIQFSSPADAKKENTRTFLALAFLEILAFLLILRFCNIKYEVSDDFIIESIVSGVYTGEPNAHLMFSNLLWGEFLVIFYRIFPTISWYFFFQVSFCLLALLALTYLLVQNQPRHLCVPLIVCLYAFSARDLFLLPQFTKTAAVLSSVGGIFFLWALFEKKSRRFLVFGGGLTLIGSFYRFKGFYVAAIFILLYFLSRTLFCPDFSNRARGRSKGSFLRAARRLRPVFLLLVLLIGTQLINEASYYLDSDYRFYKEYLYARSTIVDYPTEEYAVYAAQLEEIGISETDFQLLVSWTFSDLSVYSLETMQAVAEIVETYRASHRTSLLSAMLTVLRRKSYFYPMGICCILFGLFYLFCQHSVCRKKRQLLLPFVAALVLFLFFTGFACIGRNVYRVEFGFLFSAAVLLCAAAKRPKTGKPSFCLSLLCTLLLILTQLPAYLPDSSYTLLSDEEYRTYVEETFYHSGTYFSEKYTKCIGNRSIYGTFLEEVLSHPDQLYLLDFDTTIQTLYYDFSPFYSAASQFPDNLFYLGGVTIHHPALTAALEMQGLSDLLPSLLTEGVYLVSNNTSDLILSYLKEHYNPNITKELYATLDGYQIWSYHVTSE